MQTTPPNAIPPAGNRAEKYADPIDGVAPNRYGPVQAPGRSDNAPGGESVTSNRAKPRRRSAGQAQKKMPVVQREPGLDVFPAMTDEQMPPEELLMMLMRLLNTA